MEIVANEPFDNERGRGQYTQKIYYLGRYASSMVTECVLTAFSFMPSLVTALLPANSRYVIEKAWNVFPHCRTGKFALLARPCSSSAPEMHHNLLKDRFSVVIESKHLPDAGTTENTFGLTREELENRKIIWIDIAADKLKENRSDLDPTTFKSAKTQRGNLQGKWWETHTPIMCCYKLVTVKFQVFGFQTKVEDYIMKVGSSPLRQSPYSHNSFSETF